MLRTVVAVVGDRTAAFELGVLSEVFGLDRTSDGPPGYDFTVCSARTGWVPTTSGFAIQVEHGLARLADADLIAVPAWSDDEPLPPELVAALHAAYARGARLLAVCSGAFLLAAVGLLDGRRAATHWKYADTLAARYPAVDVDRDVLYIDAGQIVTSAGTAAAIDACLHVVRQEHGGAVASALARHMVVSPHREGGQAQFVENPVFAAEVPGGLGRVLDWAQAHLADPLSVEVLAQRASMSPRTFARRFRASTGTTPHQWVLEQRVLAAERLLEETDLGVDDIAHRCGMGSPDTIRHHFHRRRRLSPSAYRRAFRTATAPTRPATSVTPHDRRSP